jgi:hypothetical protein
MKVTLCIKTIDMIGNKIRTTECATMKEAMAAWKKIDQTKVVRAYIRKFQEWDYTIVKTLKV